MLSDLFAATTPGQLTFEQERDDLLRRYEADGRYCANGQYAPAAFAGLRECFLPKLRALLQRYASAFPYLRDALELELSRPKEVLPTGRTAYAFDGLFLVERLARRVGRLRVSSQPVAGIVRPVFAGLRAARPFLLVARQQRHHYEQAGLVLRELAAATTRDALSQTPEIATALCQLRAFFPTDAVPPLADHQALLAGLLARDGQGKAWPAAEASAIGRWWQGCYGPASTWPHPDQRADWQRQHAEAYHRFTPPAPEHSLTEAEARELIANTRQAAHEPGTVLFSAAFFRLFFLESVLPASCQEPSVRVRLGAAGLFGLTAPSKPTTSIERQLRTAAMRQLQDLTNQNRALLGSLFEELTAWTAAHPLPLAYHDQLGSYLGPDTVAGGLRDFYACLQSEDMPDPDQPWPPAETRAALCRLVPELERLPPAGTAIVASYLRQPLRAIFDSPGFLADLRVLTDLYGLLREELTADEQWFIETSCLEQLSADAPEALDLLRQSNALGRSLRHRLRQQLAGLAVDSPAYAEQKSILFGICPPTERAVLESVLLTRYDIRHFLIYASNGGLNSRYINPGMVSGPAPS